MTQHPAVKFIAVVVLVASAWLVFSRLPGDWSLWAALVIIAAATLWLLVALIRRPREAGRSVKSWFRAIWEAISGV